MHKPQAKCRQSLFSFTRVHYIKFVFHIILFFCGSCDMVFTMNLLLAFLRSILLLSPFCGSCNMVFSMNLLLTLLRSILMLSPFCQNSCQDSPDAHLNFQLKWLSLCTSKGSYRPRCFDCICSENKP